MYGTYTMAAITAEHASTLTPNRQLLEDEATCTGPRGKNAQRVRQRAMPSTAGERGGATSVLHGDVLETVHKQAVHPRDAYE